MYESFEDGLTTLERTERLTAQSRRMTDRSQLSLFELLVSGGRSREPQSDRFPSAGGFVEPRWQRRRSRLGRRVANLPQQSRQILVGDRHLVRLQGTRDDGIARILVETTRERILDGLIVVVIAGLEAEAEKPNRSLFAFRQDESRRSGIDVDVVSK